MVATLLQLSPAIIAASVAIVAAILTPSVTSLRARRQTINDRFDAAVTALLLVQAARHSPTGMAARPPGMTDGQHEDFNRRVAEKGIEQFIENTAGAKAALAAIAAYVPEARQMITGGWELAEADEPALRKAIEDRRSEALAAERLFRQRKGLG